jgi:hypothetical protein
MQDAECAHYSMLRCKEEEKAYDFKELLLELSGYQHCGVAF